LGSFDGQSLRSAALRAAADRKVTGIRRIRSIPAICEPSICCKGLYGALAFIVSQRRQEIGVRIAVGARRAEVLGLIIRQGSFLMIAGVVLGVAAARSCMHLLAGLLFGVTPTDLVVFTVVPVALGCAGLLAMLLPARRAATIDPAGLLRGE
jgi:ABC-type antimicrobial peptide transport system permease subunit